MASILEKSIRGTVTKGIETLAGFNRRRLADTDHPYLSGIHRPMEEELTLPELKVDGQIPAALDGSYMRIGPNPYAPSAAGYHWFVGDGMVHSIRLKDGKASYRNRWIRSNELASQGGPAAAPGPRRGMRDNVNTNVVGIAGRPTALVEAGAIRSPSTMRSMARPSATLAAHLMERSPLTRTSIPQPARTTRSSTTRSAPPSCATL
jgi:carotenoid cleavage dioxygenase